MQQGMATPGLRDFKHAQGHHENLRYFGRNKSKTGFWQPGFACAPVNGEKALVPTWPYVAEFPAILQKYNKRVSIRTFDEEEWTIFESHDASLKIADLLTEFGINTQDRVISDVDKLQKMKR